MKSKIGVFDSGLGGLSVANAIRVALPEYEVIFRNDEHHVPYGKRDPEEILGFIVPIFEELIAEGCKVIVVACNTVTTTLIGQLRDQFEVPLVAIEPMVKPASKLTQTGVIAVCATPTTLNSERYAELKRQYAKDVTIIEPDCSDWSDMIQNREVDQDKIAKQINNALEKNADTIVLACTHYHWIEEEINQLTLGKAKVIQPTRETILQLKKVLLQLK